MIDRFVVWIDDEPNLVSGEMFDLETKGIHTILIHDAGDALDWFAENELQALEASAIIIDLLMPSRGDERLATDNVEYVGLSLCKILEKTFAGWPQIRPWITLYTRSPNTPNLELAREFAKKRQIHLVRKTPVAESRSN